VNLKHARSCKKSSDDCPTCQDNIEAYGKLSLVYLSELLSDVKTAPFRTSIAAQAVDKLIDRTTHSSKRAKADVVVAMATLKQYEQRGGSL